MHQIITILKCETLAQTTPMGAEEELRSNYNYSKTFTSNFSKSWKIDDNSDRLQGLIAGLP